MERPLLLPLLSIGCGISLAVLCSWALPLWPLIPLLILAGASLFQRSRMPFLLSLSLLLAIWGNLAIQPKLTPPSAPNQISRFAGDSELIIEGIIDSRPEPRDRGCRAHVQAEKICSRAGYIPVAGRVLLSIGAGRTRLATGDRVRFRSRLTLPRKYGLPGEFDYARHLAFRDVFVTAFVKGEDDLLLMRSGVAYPVRRWLDRVSATAGDAIQRSAPQEEAAVLCALLLGEQGGVPRPLVDAYAASGVNHVLSISGFHLGVISLVLFQLLFRAASRSSFLLLHCNLRRSVLLLTLPVMVGYMFLTGAAPATGRSVIMLSVFVLALVAERESDPLDSLLLAAVVILALTPAALFDLSFQLSFLAMWGLLVLTPVFMRPFDRLPHPWLRKVLLVLCASVAATAATMLPVAHYFHRVSVAGLIANFLVVPLLGYGAVIVGFAALPLVWLAPTAAEGLFTVAGFLVWVSDRLIILMAKIPVITWLNPGRAELFLFFLFVVSFTFMGKGWPKRVCSGASAGLCILLLCVSPLHGREQLVISCLSVGQGEAILIRFPDGRHMLVDGGGNPFGPAAGDNASTVGERLLAPALRSMGVSRIDFLVLSHAHPDHLQGLSYIAETFPIGEFREGPCRAESEEYRRLKLLLASRKIPVKTVVRGDGAERIGDVTIEILTPFDDAGEPGEENDHSLVFRLAFGSFSMLFTGDIGFAGEQRLLRDPGCLGATVLKVAHHGSRHSTSDEFLRAISPRAAVVSAGYRNRFHLPSPETLRRLSRAGTGTWRTDLQGTVTIQCDKAGNWGIEAPFGQPD